MYEVLDHNDDVLESTDSWAIAAQVARENGFRVRDTEDGSIQYDASQE